MRQGNWKLVAAKGEPWELYHLSHDRTELHDVADAQPDRVKVLEQAWQKIAAENLQLADLDGKLNQPLPRPKKKQPAKSKSGAKPKPAPAVNAAAARSWSTAGK